MLNPTGSPRHLDAAPLEAARGEGPFIENEEDIDA
jgi:hypothetical protein